MQKSKKLLAVLLAMVLALSTMSVAMVAFAEDSEPAPAADPLTELVNGLGKLIGSAKENLTPEQAEALAKAEGFVKQIADSTDAAAKDFLADNDIDLDDLMAIDDVDDFADLVSTYAVEEEGKGDGDEAPEVDPNAPTANAKKFMEKLDAIDEKDFTDAEFKTVFYSYYADLANKDDLKTLPAEYVEKFSAVYDKFVEDHKVKNPVDISGYDALDVNYPLGASYTKVDHFLGTMDGLVNELLAGLLAEGSTDLQDALNKGVYTNATVSMVASALYRLIGGIDLSGLSGMGAVLAGTVKKKLITYPNQLAGPFDAESAAAKKLYEIGGNKSDDGNKFELSNPDALGEAEYKKLHDAWSAVAENPDPEPQRFDVYWNVFDATPIDWGFEDGDKEGFIDATSRVLERAFAIVGLVLTVSEKDNSNNFDKLPLQYGLYDGVATLLEVLGAEDFMTTNEYNEYLRTNQTVSAKNGTDANENYLAVKPILSGVFNFVEQIAAAPATELMKLLPKVAYILDSGYLSDGVYNTLERNKTVVLQPILDAVAPGLYPFDLTTGGLLDMILPMLGNYEDGAVALTVPVAEGKDIEIVIKKDDIAALIHNLACCGQLTGAVSKASNMNKYIPVLTADAPDAFVTVFRFLCKFIKIDVLAYNVERLADYVKDQGLSVIGWKISVIAEAIRRCNNCDAALVALVNVLDFQLPQLPSLPDFDLPELPNLELPDLGGIFDFIGGIFDGIELPDLGGILDTIGGIFGGIFDFIGGLFGGGGDGGDDGNEPDDGDGDMFPGDDDDDGLGGDVDADDIPNTASATAGAVFAALAVLSAAGAAVVAYKRKDDEE